MNIIYLLCPYLILAKKDFSYKNTVIFILSLLYSPITLSLLVVMAVFYFSYFGLILMFEILKKITKQL